LALQIIEKRALNSHYNLQQAATPDQITQQLAAGRGTREAFLKANVTTTPQGTQ
jgi:hypothetical protein